MKELLRTVLTTIEIIAVRSRQMKSPLFKDVAGSYGIRQDILNKCDKTFKVSLNTKKYHKNKYLGHGLDIIKSGVRRGLRRLNSLPSLRMWWL